MDFPQYRKYDNNKNFFKIISEEEFEEVQLTGDSAEVHTVKAGIHPDRMRIQDMLNNEGGHWVTISEDEYERARTSG